MLAQEAPSILSSSKITPKILLQPLLKLFWFLGDRLHESLYSLGLSDLGNHPSSIPFIPWLSSPIPQFVVLMWVPPCLLSNESSKDFRRLIPVTQLEFSSAQKLSWTQSSSRV
ncbi:hypothetical protein SAY87_016538 [Trapa incisa]|uniref:Uncharacterized protein n=1 Tax=Trapa incisa TaxID=236973 RepID=A0AAN7L672_9MYRT|nr:hypothetical protein SAY87_016538 [Trapa incisa]